MKKILLTALMVPAMALAQTFPSPTFNSLTLQNPLSVSSGGSGATSSTGAGSVVLSTSPTLTTPNLGTPSAVTLTNGAGLPISTGVSGLGTGVATALGNAVTGSGSPVLAISPTINTPTISGGTITNAPISGSTGSFTALAASGAITGTGFNNLFASPPNIGAVVPATGAFTTLSASTPIAVSSGGTGANTAAGATSNLQYLPSFTGAVAESLTAKFQHDVSVCDFGGCGGGDVSTAFQAAVNALPAGGGKIDVPDGSYTVNTAPSWGSRSIYWNFGPNATVSGTQTTFPRMATNFAQVPVGPWIQSQSTAAAPNNGGIAALNAEMLQPSSYVGQSVALYTGASGSSSNVGSNVWSINNLVQANVGAVGFYQGMETDVNDFAPGATAWGINISGVGTAAPTTGITINRVSGPNWKTGIALTQFDTGIQLGGGIEFPNSLISGGQTANGNDGIVLQRVTDTSPTGSFIRGVNAANSVNMFNIDVSGNASFNGALSAGSITGVTNGSSAAAGSVGQVLDNFISSPVSMTNNTSTNIVSETLPAGDWDVTCNVLFDGASTTTFSNSLVGVSATSATLPSNSQWSQQAFTTSTAPIWSLVAPTVPVNVSTSTPVFCVGFLSFANGTATAIGRIHARRMR